MKPFQLQDNSKVKSNWPQNWLNFLQRIALTASSNHWCNCHCPRPSQTPEGSRGEGVKRGRGWWCPSIDRSWSISPLRPRDSVVSIHENQRNCLLWMGVRLSKATARRRPYSPTIYHRRPIATFSRLFSSKLPNISKIKRKIKRKIHQKSTRHFYVKLRHVRYSVMRPLLSRAPATGHWLLREHSLGQTSARLLPFTRWGVKPWIGPFSEMGSSCLDNLDLLPSGPRSYKTGDFSMNFKLLWIWKEMKEENGENEPNH